MKLFKIFSLLIILLIFIKSCKNDLQINGDYKLVTVVYGLLNLNDTTHYLKIYKTFLTEDNVFVAAQNQDNYSFYDSIKVYLVQKFENNTTIINFDTTTEIPKNTGYFSSPKQILYKSTSILNPDAEFELKIENKITGVEIANSSTLLVKPYFNNYQNPFNIRGLSQNYVGVINFANTSNAEFKIASTVNSLNYQANFEFYYFEKNTQTNITNRKGPISISLGKTKSKNSSGNEEIIFSWVPYSFYSAVAANVKEDVYAERTIDTLRLKIWAAGIDFSNYIDANSSNYSIIEDRPIITNIAGGLGLFSSRLQGEYKYVMTTISLDSLRKGQYTRKLNFK